MNKNETGVLEMLDETTIMLNGYRVYFEYDTIYDNGKEVGKGLYINVDEETKYNNLRFDLIYQTQLGKDTEQLDSFEIQNFMDMILGRVNQHLKETTNELTKDITKCNKSKGYKEQLEFHHIIMGSVVKQTELILNQY